MSNITYIGDDSDNDYNYSEEYIKKALKYYNAHLQYLKEYREKKKETSTLEEKNMKKIKNREYSHRYYEKMKTDETFMENNRQKQKIRQMMKLKNII